MADFPDSGVSFPNGPATAYPKFTSPAIERWNEMQLEQSAADMPKSKGADEVASEIFSRLMNFSCDKANTVADRSAALQAAWNVYADYARLTNGG